MPRAVVGFAVVLVVGLAAVLVAGLTRTSGLVYGDGVAPLSPIGFLPGQRVCQQGIELPDGTRFSSVRFYAGSRGTPGQPLEVRSGNRVARVAGGYGGRVPMNVPLSGSGTVQVCFRNLGDRSATIWGSTQHGTSSSSATLDERPAVFDVSLRFERSPRSLLALLPAIGERASQFKAGVVSPGFLLFLGVVVLVGVPALLVLAE